ncbi:MAG: Gfo/Idh/MocA family protein, partial [Verrucomicrobiales bacterium]
MKSRRSFLKQAGATAFAFQVVPSRVFGANERLAVGSIGIGGKGAGDVKDIAAAGADIVALCDVDESRRGKDMTEAHPKAPFYKDFRLMLEKEGKHLDAVSVSTPDHLHCHAAVTAMRMGKHVYVQKPMAHSIWEARLMAQVAKEQGVATQMGNQAHAGEPIRRAVELIRSGIIGKVKEVHAWTNRPIWPQGMSSMPKAQPIPNSLDWYLWLGPAPDRPYHQSYCPFKWRGWWDFGTGALGDMGCHIMDMPFWALDLKHPTSVEAKSDGATYLSAPRASTVTYQFPAGQYSKDLKFCWYDGNK